MPTLVRSEDASDAVKGVLLSDSERVFDSLCCASRLKKGCLLAEEKKCSQGGAFLFACKLLAVV